LSTGKFGMTFVMLAIFAAMVGVAWQYPPESRFMPLVVGIPAIVLCLLQLYLDFRDWSKQRRMKRDVAPTPRPVERMPALSAGARREMAMWGYFLGLVGGVLLFGFFLAIPVFVFVFLRYWAKTSWRFAFGLTVTGSAVFYLIFIQGLGIVPHPGFVTEYVIERFSSEAG
jgi:hypothetical protein